MEEYMFLLSVLCWYRGKSEPFNVTLLFLVHHILLFMILFHSCILPFSVISTWDQDFSTDGTNMSTLIWCHVRLIGWIAHFVLKNGFFSTFSFNCFNSSTAHKWFPNVSLLLWYPFGLPALALVVLIACHGLDESWLMIQKDRHVKSLPWHGCTFLVMCAKASLCVCYSHVLFICVSIDFPKCGNIGSWDELFERAFFQSCQKTRLGVGFGNYWRCSDWE